MIPLSKVISEAKQELEYHEQFGLQLPANSFVHPILSHSNLFVREDFPAGSKLKNNPFSKSRRSDGSTEKINVSKSNHDFTPIKVDSPRANNPILLPILSPVSYKKAVRGMSPKYKVSFQAV